MVVHDWEVGLEIGGMSFEHHLIVVWFRTQFLCTCHVSVNFSRKQVRIGIKLIQLVVVSRSDCSYVRKVL